MSGRRLPAFFAALAATAVPSTGAAEPSPNAFFPSPAAAALSAPFRSQTLPYEQVDFGPTGIVRFLATRGGTTPYTNPAEAGILAVVASSVHTAENAPSAPSAVVGDVATRFVTENGPSEWVTIDFREKRVLPTHYALRHYSSYDTEALRSWVLEASENGVVWTTLVTHVNDTALRARGDTHAWPIPFDKRGAAYRVFRVRQTGPNSNTHRFLALSGFELYGELRTPVLLPAAVKLAVPPSTLSKVGDFASTGFVFQLGTDGGTRSFENPADRGMASVIASSVAPTSAEPPSVILGSDGARGFETRSGPDAWVLVDFLDKRVKPTRYALRHRSGTTGNALRSWVLEASNDGAYWTTLRVHEDDTTLGGERRTASWPIDRTYHDSAFRMFRVRQTGPSSSGSAVLALSGFEVYGAK